MRYFRVVVEVNEKKQSKNIDFLMVINKYPSKKEIETHTKENFGNFDYFTIFIIDELNKKDYKHHLGNK